MAEKKGKPAEKAKAYNRLTHYKVEGDKVARARRECPKCGAGVFLAEHKDRNACGRCGYTEKKPAAPPSEGGGRKGGGKKEAPAAPPA